MPGLAKQATFLALQLALTSLCGMVRAQSAVTDVSAAFPRGPYTSLYVDPSNPERVAVGTSHGAIGWMRPESRIAREAQVLLRRRFDPYVWRSGERSDLANNTQPDPAQSATDPRSKNRDQNRRDHRDSILDHTTIAPNLTPDRLGGASATRLFMSSMERGVQYPQWAIWMTLFDSITDITDVGMRPDGRMILASTAGIYISDPGAGAWTRTLGGHSPMHRDRDLTGIAVTFDPHDNGRALASTSEGLFVSRDGGMTFHPHPDRRLAEIRVSKFLWDAEVPGLLFAIADDAILRSDDGGDTFDVAHGSRAMVTGFALIDSGAFVATARGLELVAPPEETQYLMPNRAIMGVITWGRGILFATETQLIYLSDDAEARTLYVTSEQDPFLALGGGPQGAWALTRTAVLQVGSRPRGHISTASSRPRWQTPEMLLDEDSLALAVGQHLGLGDPRNTRLHQRWYAALLPSVTLEVHGSLDSRTWREDDWSILPIRAASTGIANSGNIEFVAFANWDLSQWIFGDRNVANPNLLLESQLRNMRADLELEMHERYRLAATLTHTIAEGIGNEEEELLARLRLAEHASYLEAIAGCEVVEGEEL